MILVELGNFPPTLPTPNNVAQAAKWEEMSTFGITTLSGGGGVGEWREEHKTDPKIVIRSRVLCNNYEEVSSTREIE